MRKQKNTGWYVSGGLGCSMLFCGLLWGVLIAPIYGVIALIGLIVCAFVAWYWPTSKGV